jgi:hypothetical protein
MRSQYIMYLGHLHRCYNPSIGCAKLKRIQFVTYLQLSGALRVDRLLRTVLHMLSTFTADSAMLTLSDTAFNCVGVCM